MFATLVLATGCIPGSWPGAVLQPWSKASQAGGLVLAVDPEDRDGSGAALTTLRDATGAVLWSKRLEFSLREAEISAQGDVVGWAARKRDERYLMSIVVLDPGGEPRSVDWWPDGAARVVSGIVLVPAADRAIVRLDPPRGHVITNDREEWLGLRLSTGERLGRFVPPVLQRDGFASLRRVSAVAGRPLVCCEAWFGGGEVLVELLDLEGRSIWSQALEEHLPRDIDRLSWSRWVSSSERLASLADGEFGFQRFSPEELVKWRVSERADAPGTWAVAEASRTPHPTSFVPHPYGIEPETLHPRILGERSLGDPAQGTACSEARWTDAILDEQGRLIVLEPQLRHLHAYAADGTPLPVTVLEEAGLTVDRILGVREREIDLRVGDSFATWSRSGARLTPAYGPYHRALPIPARHARDGDRWFHDEHALLRFADDDPTNELAARVPRRPDRTWFEDIENLCAAPDGTLIALDVEPGTLTLASRTCVSRFDAKGGGLGVFWIRMVIGEKEGLSTDGRWLAGRSVVLEKGFLLDLEKQRLIVLDAPEVDGRIQVLLPRTSGEFWIVDLKQKRLLRAAFPAQ